MSREEAIQLAQNADVGSPNAEITLSTQSGLTIIVGELGLGKSLVAERLLQAAISRAKLDRDAPLPIFYPASEASQGLLQLVARDADKVQGENSAAVFAVVDGVDETDPRAARPLVNDSRLLVNSRSNSTVIITSRPHAIFLDCPERVELPPLSEEDATSLVSDIIGYRFPANRLPSNLPITIRDAVRRPLFAILLGMHYRRRDGHSAPGMASLISDLIEATLSSLNANVEEMTHLLAAIAVKRIERGGGIPTSEAGDSSKVDLLVNAGVLVRDRTKVDFAIRVFAEWFAARALAFGTVSPADLCRDPATLERWRYPLVIATGTLDHDFVSKLLAPIVEQYPGFSGTIIDDAISRWRGSDDAALPTATECGERVIEAMRAFVKGCGPLATLIAPISSSGTPERVYVRVDGDRLTVGWPGVSDGSKGVSAMPPGNVIAMDMQSMGLVRVRSAAPPIESAWAWKWVHSELADALKELIRKRQIPVKSGPMADEAIWHTSIEVTGTGVAWFQPILVDDVSRALFPFRSTAASNESLSPPSWSTRPVRDFAALLRLTNLVGGQRSSKDSHIIHPLPPPDLPRQGPYSWTWYSDEQLASRVRTAYEMALRSYNEIVNAWFIGFQPHLNMAALCPVQIDIVISRDNQERGVAGFPWMNRWVRALPVGAANKVNVEIGSIDKLPGSFVGLNDAYADLQSLRPDSSDRLHLPWCTSVIDDLLAWDAVTKTVYSWLEDDLRHINWMP